MGNLEQMGEMTPEKEEGKTWVQDMSEEEAKKFIMEKNAQIETEEIKSPKASKYEIGPSKGGKEGEVGIYFFEPMAKEEKE